MAYFDRGLQQLAFDYKQEATSHDFNRINNGLVIPGLYKGGNVKILDIDAATAVLTVDPFIGAFKTTFNEKDIVVNVETLNSIQDFPIKEVGSYPINNGTWKLVCWLDWVQQVDNFLNFALTEAEVISNVNEITLCKLNGTGTSTPPIISYDYINYGMTFSIPSLDSTPVLLKGTGEYNKLRIESGEMITFPNSDYMIEFYLLNHPEIMVQVNCSLGKEFFVQMPPNNLLSIGKDVNDRLCILDSQLSPLDLRNSLLLKNNLSSKIEILYKMQGYNK